MKNTVQLHLPMARTSQLVQREVAGEMLVYDQNNDKAHCLNPITALVWKHCDGRTTIAKVTRLLADELKTPVGEDVVWYALEQLRKSQLLDEPYAGPPPMGNLTRRALMARLGLVAALTVPFIHSMTAPAAAQAASCFPNGAGCAANADCCSNNCVDNGRGFFQCA